jgi:hypothetical protein
MDKIYAERISLIKLIVVAAFLSFLFQIIYEAFNSAGVSERNELNEGFAINIGDLLNSVLFEYFFIFLVTLFTLLGVRFLYLYLKYGNENKIK